jgi:hypothetical protein
VIGRRIARAFQQNADTQLNTTVDVAAGPDRSDTTDSEYLTADELDTHVLVWVSDGECCDVSAVGRNCRAGVLAHLGDELLELGLRSGIHEPTESRTITMKDRAHVRPRGRDNARLPPLGRKRASGKRA